MGGGGAIRGPGAVLLPPHVGACGRRGTYGAEGPARPRVPLPPSCFLFPPSPPAPRASWRPLSSGWGVQVEPFGWAALERGGGAGGGESIVPRAGCCAFVVLPTAPPAPCRPRWKSGGRGIPFMGEFVNKAPLNESLFQV